MLPEVRTWLRRRTSCVTDWPLRDLVAAKGRTTVSVVLPARDERETVGEIVTVIRRELGGLVDEIVVIDSRSTDDTALVAARAGATVHAQDEILPRLKPLDGKGEALWKSLAVTSGDVLVFADADIRKFRPSLVFGLLGPILADPTVVYAKACYDRPLNGCSNGGGRVTELVARPLINLHWPRLAGFVQPLAGEYAGRRSALERVPFLTGYGVELGLLIDLLELAGLDAFAQVDLGSREHAPQSTEALGGMASQIMLAAWSRLERQGKIETCHAPSLRLAQFRRAGDGHDVLLTDIGIAERPPMITMAA
ncbi:glucosyl-3-phosphoglycerate synthase [Nonomuraea sp. KC401]|uniref:glucosyl-3-phosphoglycerate synthase n=1 Tax=unclassified Nonomuraea TaxID=2593643 RepID=UPI0010FD29CC|nr:MULTISPECIES: glucosyl-3-phosphoglycerate synthase [unclassified Nonomuraea]NBE98920.1 glucosyl-3-phosphoglycerate synthase [Nonomuraea sp. K271]TLF59311.1 glucosyl-3-phosphoglycerate synthase [Nonomuraea sp. KC401]